MIPGKGGKKGSGAENGLAKRKAGKLNHIVAETSGFPGVEKREV